MKLLKSVKKAYIINVKDSIYRYNHTVYELSKLSNLNFNIVKAFTPSSKEVINFYKDNLVKSFPVCFRCHKVVCDHQNNILIPRQVANFLSFKKVFELILENEFDNDSLFLILEDDFVLQPTFTKSIKHLNKFIERNNLDQKFEPVLIRVGSHTKSIKRINFKFKYLNLSTFTKDNYNMANPGFIINKYFCKLFLNEFKEIFTTSDDFIHKYLCKNFNVLNYSIEPFFISQLSYGSAINKFSSDINIVSKQFKDKERAQNKEEYIKLKLEWISDKVTE